MLMKYIEVKQFNFPVVAFTTTNKLGNVAFQVGNNKEEVLNNRKQLANDFNMDINDYVYTYQFHPTILAKVNKNEQNKGTYSFNTGVRADALYTKDYNIPLCIFHADCVPIFVYDPTIPLVGIIHAGKKGSIDEITFKSLLSLITNEGVDPRNLHLHLGPSLNKDRETISEEEKQYLIMHGYDTCVNGNNLDKAKLNIEQALRLGVFKENITQSDVDTFENELTYSASNLNKEAGRMASIIYLKS